MQYGTKSIRENILFCSLSLVLMFVANMILFISPNEGDCVADRVALLSSSRVAAGKGEPWSFVFCLGDLFCMPISSSDAVHLLSLGTSPCLSA